MGKYSFITLLTVFLLTVFLIFFPIGVGPDLTEETLLRSIATALHVSGQAIVGQTNSRIAFDKNPSVYINPEQPLVQVVFHIFIL